MSTEDVDELLKGVDIKNDSVNYSGMHTAMVKLGTNLSLDFVKMILSN